jgi:hypothetical protein
MEFNFENLNLFIAEEVIPLNANPDIIKLEELEVNQPNDSILKFKTITVINDPSSYDELTREGGRTIPWVFKPLLERLYDQIITLLGDQRYGLTELFKLATDVKNFLPFVDGLKQKKQRIVSDLASNLRLEITRLYSNVFEYLKLGNQNDMLSNVGNITLREEAVYRPDFEGSRENPLGSKIISRLETGHLKSLTPIQQISLFRLIWAVESILKVKYAIMEEDTTIIFLDNIEFQIRHLYYPLYATRFNHNQLAIFDNSPQFKDRTETIPFKIEHLYSGNITDIESQYVSSYSFRETEKDVVVISRKTFNYDYHLLMYNFAFLPENKMEISS